MDGGDKLLFYDLAMTQVATIITVTSAKWTAIKADIRNIEQVSFPPPIRDTPEYLFGLVKSPTSIFLAMEIGDSMVVGYIAADVLEKFSNVPGIKSDPDFNKRTTIYIESVAVLPHWRKQGLGIALETQCITRAHERGFNRVTAHIQRGVSEKMGMNVKVLRTFKNWYGTGRTFDYVEFLQ